MKKVIVITGPTAVGKTSLSIKLAKALNGEIINADASQFHRLLNIGTAKITTKEMDGVKHHFIDCLDPLEEFSIKDYQEQGRKLIDEIDVPIIVGGSGLYINALITDYHLDNEKREIEDSTKTNEELYEELKQLDLSLAQKTHPNNRKRVLRYLQFAKQGIKITPPEKKIYKILNLCLVKDREILYNYINNRCDEMFKNGWIEECIDLKNKGIDLSKVKEIGYSDINNYLDNKIDLDTCISTIKQKTRHLAKRQMTWFKNKMDCKFINMNYQEDTYILLETTCDLFLN